MLSVQMLNQSSLTERRRKAGRFPYVSKAGRYRPRFTLGNFTPDLALKGLQPTARIGFPTGPRERYHVSSPFRAKNICSG